MTTTIEDPVDTRTLEVPGAVLAYDVRGDLSTATESTPALVIAGTPMTAEPFTALAERFDDRPVITYDPRNTGRSRWTTGTTPTPEDHASDLHAPDLGTQRPTSDGNADHQRLVVVVHNAYHRLVRVIVDRVGFLLVAVRESSSCSSRCSPVHQCERRRRVVVGLEHGLDRRIDLNRLHRIAEKITDHPHVAGVRQLHQHDHVRRVPAQGWMHGMVRALPRIDLAAGLDRRPFQVEGQAVMTDPFRAPLPAAARPATLDAQLAGPCPFPVRRVEPVGLRHRTR